MPSPFPGMNPFLEQNDSWEDFHGNFITSVQALLNPRVGPNYFVKIEVRRIFHELSAEEGRFPVQLQLPAVDIERHSSLEIRDRRNRRVVTVIELLSPSNKGREDREDYLAKRRQILAGPTHLVEIDLRRGGQRPDIPQLPPCSYYALVSKPEDRPRIGFWPIGLRDTLPTIPIPLAEPDLPVQLDLKAVLDRAYDAADYGKYIYLDTPEPPLSAEDAAWATEVISKASGHGARP